MSARKSSPARLQHSAWPPAGQRAGPGKSAPGVRGVRRQGDEAIIRKEGDRLIVEPVRKGRLLALLAKLEPIAEPFLIAAQASVLGLTVVTQPTTGSLGACRGFPWRTGSRNELRSLQSLLSTVRGDLVRVSSLRKANRRQEQCYEQKARS